MIILAKSWNRSHRIASASEKALASRGLFFVGGRRPFCPSLSWLVYVPVHQHIQPLPNPAVMVPHRSRCEFLRGDIASRSGRSWPRASRGCDLPVLISNHEISARFPGVTLLYIPELGAAPLAVRISARGYRISFRQVLAPRFAGV
jgi:hypothetical protein